MSKTYVIMDEAAYFITFSGRETADYGETQKFYTLTNAKAAAKAMKRKHPSRFYDIVEDYGLDSQNIAASI